MTTLAADVARVFELGDQNHIGAIASDIIYEGAAVGENGSGYGRPLEAGDPFVGFATERCDNSAGSAGDKNVHLKTRGRVRLAIDSLAITDVGAAVFASDDNTFVLTQSTNTYIGVVTRFVSTGVGIVAFDAAAGGDGTLVELTDNSGGTPGDTLADITEAQNSGSADRVPTENAIASLAAKVNALARRIG